MKLKNLLLKYNKYQLTRLIIDEYYLFIAGYKYENPDNLTDPIEIIKYNISKGTNHLILNNE